MKYIYYIIELLMKNILKIIISISLLILTIYWFWNTSVAANQSTVYNNPYSNSITSNIQEKIILIVDRIKNRENNYSPANYKNYIEWLSSKLSKLKSIYKNKTDISEVSKQKILNIISFVNYEFDKLIKDIVITWENCEVWYSWFACDIIGWVFSSDGSHYSWNSIIVIENESSGTSNNTTRTCAEWYWWVWCNIYNWTFVNESHYSDSTNNTSSTSNNTSTDNNTSDCEEWYWWFACNIKDWKFVNESHYKNTSTSTSTSDTPTSITNNDSKCEEWYWGFACNIKDWKFVSGSYYKIDENIEPEIVKAYIWTTSANKTYISVTKWNYFKMKIANVEKQWAQFCISDNSNRKTPACWPLTHWKNLWYYINNSWVFNWPANFPLDTYIWFFKTWKQVSNKISLKVTAVNTVYKYNTTSWDSRCQTWYLWEFCDITTKWVFSTNGSHYK